MIIRLLAFSPDMVYAERRIGPYTDPRSQNALLDIRVA